MFYAHSTNNPDRSDWHRLADHLHDVAALAGQYASGFGALRAAALAGALHDLGKYSNAFQRRLGGAPEKVDHSTAGAREVMAMASSPKAKLVTELIAYAIAGHHAGLPDKLGESGSLADRLSPDAYDIEPLEPVWKSEVQVSATDLFPAGFKWSSERREAAFQIAFLGRMIFSCLVDADFRDTERFYASVQAQTIDREWPQLPDLLERLVAKFNAHMDRLQRESPKTEVNELRRDILAHVRSKAELRPGVFTLNVPTGGGKTLAGLGFALDHAQRHGLRRIITAIPFTSVIDQTASIFRNVLGDDVVLEHHSAIEEERIRGREARDKLRLAMEDWAAPIVVTTNVQLFESLFSNRPSRCRKLHNIAHSVIVLDEAQTIPLHVLRPAVAALKELVRNYGCSVVLCTATQPALAAPDFAGGFELLPERELAPNPDRLHAALRRTVLRRESSTSDSELIEAARSFPRSLIIVNSRKHALYLYRAARDAGIESAVHLSTRQTAADRRRIIAVVKERLRRKESCFLIATSLVEAGVDLDFPRVWRAEAGLDQITQAAGRCNREGHYPVEESVVTVFKPADAKPPAEIKAFAEDFARMASKHDDLLSPPAIRDYFGEVYWRKGDALDKHTILATERNPNCAFRVSGGETFFDYRKVGENFRLIQSGMLPVIIAVESAPKKVLDELRNSGITAGVAARDLQSYIVQVPPRARAELMQQGHVAFVSGFDDQFVELVNTKLYSPELGLSWEDAGERALDDFII